MFGYIQPLKPELKIKEYEAYKGYYCGLCKSIKENYTNTARFMLNYDCAVLYILLSSMSDADPVVASERCFVSPFKKKTVVRCDEASYAAAVNVLLVCAKINDNVRDENSLSAKALALFYGRVNRRAGNGNVKLAEEIKQRLENLFALESERCDDIDRAADEFANILAAVFSMAPFKFINAAAKKTLWHFGYNLGRWVYIADAVSDIEKDIKKNNYNVFVQRFSGGAKKVKDAAKEEAEFNLKFSLSQACKAYELLDIKRDKPLLDNIMYLGLAKKTEDVLKGETDGSV
ncbi:MAG: DUF5685 family protein [Christensenellales bacterium]